MSRKDFCSGFMFLSFFLLPLFSTASWLVEPGNTVYEYRPNEEFTVQINLHGDGQEIDALGFDFNFPNSLLEYKGSDFSGSLLEGWQFKDATNPSENVIRIGGFTTTGKITSPANGVLAKLTFSVRANAQGEGFFSINNLTDDLSNSETGTATFKVKEENQEIEVTINSAPTGRKVLIDGTAYTAPVIQTWTNGSSHTLSTDQTQNGGTGVQYSFTHWDEGSGRIIIVTATPSKTTYTAYFVTKYYLTTSVDPPGEGQISPSSGWYAKGTNVQISAQPAPGSNYSFSGWSGDWSGSQNPTTILMDAPKTVVANFVNVPPRQITVTTEPPGLDIFIDGTTYTAPQIFNWQTGQKHEIGISGSQIMAPGTRETFESWSDGGARVHNISVPNYDATFTANLITEYELTTVNNPVDGGTISNDPSGSWFPQGTYVTLTAAANSSDNYTFSNWGGDVSGASNPVITRMDAPRNVTANYMQLSGSQVLVRFPSGLTAAPGDTVEVPVLILTDATGMGIISYQFTLNFNGSILQAIGVDVDETLTQGWQPTVFNNSTYGQIKVGGYNTTELSGSGVLVKLVFKIIGSQGSQSDLQFSEFIFNSGVPTADLQSGRFQVEREKPDISGYVYYYNSSHPIQYVRMNITGGIPTELTKVNGYYEFLDLTPGNSYTVSPSMPRYAHIPGNCIHASDASLAAQAVFNLATLTDLQKQAADVDKDGKVLMFDASQILYYAVLGIPLSNASYVGEWLFKEESKTYANLIHNQRNQNYEAIVLGDVNADLPNPPTLAKETLRVADFGEEMYIEPGGEFNLTFPAIFSKPFLTLFFKMEYDPDVMTLESLKKSEQAKNLILFQKTENGRITCGILADKPTLVKDGLINIVFKALDKKTLAKIEFKKFTIDAEPAIQLVQSVNIGQNVNSAKTFQLQQNYPNPFNPSTKISYSLPWESPQQTVVKIYDIKGGLVQTLVNTLQAKGEYEIEWNGLDDKGMEIPSGLYFCLIRSGNFMKNIKMLKTK